MFRVRAAGFFAVLGAALGAVVGVIAHFASRTVPHTFYVGVSRPEGAGTAEATLGTPLVHPSWWPTLFVAVVVGLVLGAAVGLAFDRAGLRVVRAAAGTGE